jgi:hypothetical protein
MTTFKDWDAWRDRTPGADDTDLHVAGVCECESASIEVTLEPGNEGIVDEQDLFVLQLTLTRPDSGFEKRLTWQGPVDGDVTRVRIQGDATATIQVRDVNRDVTRDRWLSDVLPHLRQASQSLKQAAAIAKPKENGTGEVGVLAEEVVDVYTRVKERQERLEPEAGS